MYPLVYLLFHNTSPEWCLVSEGSSPCGRVLHQSQLSVSGLYWPHGSSGRSVGVGGVEVQSLRLIASLCEQKSCEELGINSSLGSWLTRA